MFYIECILYCSVQIMFHIECVPYCAARSTALVQAGSILPNMFFRECIFNSAAQVAALPCSHPIPFDAQRAHAPARAPCPRPARCFTPAVLWNPLPARQPQRSACCEESADAAASFHGTPAAPRGRGAAPTRPRSRWQKAERGRREGPHDRCPQHSVRTVRVHTMSTGPCAAQAHNTTAGGYLRVPRLPKIGLPDRPLRKEWPKTVVLKQVLFDISQKKL